MRRTRTFLSLAHAIFFAFAPGDSTAQTSSPLAAMNALVGTWEADTEDFGTTLNYRWALPGYVLEVTNVVRDAQGNVLARYAGLYAWDGGREEITFFTATQGEVHRGRAWWDGDILWHEAEVSGGRLTHYASAVRLRGARIEYFADYSAADADEVVLQSQPIVYLRSSRSHH